MKKIIKILSYITAVLFCAIFSCCSRENNVLTDAYPLAVTVDISGVPNEATRADRTDEGDQWSYKEGQSFQEGDEIGFYAASGKYVPGEEESAPFVNELLEFNGSQFVSPGNGAIFSPSQMEGSPTFMYFQYNEDIEDPGIKLRVKPSEDNDTLRCIDFLSSTNLMILGSTKALYGSFEHAFSELIIMRGEGFDAPPNWTINVVMSQPVTHLKITTDEEHTSFQPELTYVASDGLSGANARKWTAWHGYNYGITENNDPVGQPAWYVIVPSLKSNYATVEYIELYDNDGYLQRVSSLNLHDHSKRVQPGWRYPLKIAMKELVPTVNPFPIMPWGPEVNLTDERKRGIGNEVDFANWVRDYNLYLLDPENTTQQEVLLNYGDRYVNAQGQTFWHFYILNDIDLSRYSPLPYEIGEVLFTPEEDVIIPEFHDILDGKSTNVVDGEFVNYKLSNMTAPFIGNLEPWDFNNDCSVVNIDFIDPEIIYNESESNPVGIIANSISKASVENCNISNGTLMNPGGPAGMICGTMTDGSLKDCNLTGFIIYGTTATDPAAAKIVGTNPEGSSTIENVNIAGVVTQ